MPKNKVIEHLERVATSIGYVCGSINDIGSNKCKLDCDEKIGAVYGIAIKLNENEKNKFFREIGQSNDLLNKKISSCKSWEPFDGDWYPLYWGKDKYMISRLYSHCKTHKGKWTLQLNKNIYLQNKNIIYGAILCENYAEIEKTLHEDYPDLLKTIKGQ